MVCAALVIGCRAPARTFADADPTHPNQPSIAHLVEQHQAAEPADSTHASYAQASYGRPAIDERRAAAPEPATPSVEQTERLGTVLADLHRQGAIDAETQSQLLDSLKQTDPALWPQLLAYFEAAADARHSAAGAAPPAPIVQLASTERAVPKPEEPGAPQTVLAPKSDTNSAPDAKEEASIRETADASESEMEPESKQERDSSEKPAGKPSDKPANRRTVSAAAPTVEVDPTWQQQLQASIAKLEQETQHAPATHEEIGKHAALRILYLAAGRREDALKPIAGIPPAHQDFWSKELYGLAALIDHGRNPDTSRRAAEARGHLRDAAARLGELATLQVCNLTCCREVTSYGVYKPFETTVFHPGQELLLYAEIENFKSQHTDQGYHTALKASYQILDERGARVDEKEFALTEEYCQNPRRDFFVRYFIWLPQKIYGGTYTLQLSVEDTLCQKLGQASVNFTIEPQ